VTTAQKLYKGEILTAEKLVDNVPHAIPVQIVPQPEKYDAYGYRLGYATNLPNTFIVTKLQRSTWGDTVIMYYYDPITKARTSRTIPKDFTLNVLKGTRGRDLSKEWKTTVTSNLGKLGRRLVCTLGSDPEIFVVDKDNKIIPAWTFLPPKEKPLKYAYNRQEGTLYWDGFQAEFTTPGHHTCFSWVNDSIQAALRTLHENAQKVGGKLTIENVLPVDPEFLASQDTKHVEFGCAPSYNVYGLRGNKQDGRDVPFRFAGGHMHFGVGHLSANPEPREAQIQKYVRWLDKILAVASVSLLGELDNPIRRHFYGQPGEYRMPKHGFEYRTLSNAWMCHPLTMNMVFDLGRSVCGLAEEDLLDGWQCEEKEMIQIVMENDIAGARAILDRNKDMFKQILKVITGTFYTDAYLETAFNAWRNGVKSIVENPADLVKNWDLERTWICHGDGAGKNWGRAVELIMAGQKV
jgi:Phage phiEco32-like COOH.NH2 ligase-type 2